MVEEIGTVASSTSSDNLSIPVPVDDLLERQIAEILAKADSYPPGMLPRELEQQILDILGQMALGRVDPHCDYRREDIYAGQQ